MVNDRASVFVALQAHLEKERRRTGTAGGNPRVDVAGGRKQTRAKIPWGVKARAEKYAFKTPRYLAGKRINTIVKASYVPNNADARRHIAKHIEYIQNRERGELEPEKRQLYDRTNREVDTKQVVKDMLQNRFGRHSMYKIILSPGDNGAATREELTAIMSRWQKEAELDVPYFFVEHKNTEHHHFHVIMQGVDSDGNGYVITREHLDLLKSIANERQYRLQERDMEYEKQVERELGLAYEDSHRAHERHQHDLDMKEILGRNNRAVDQIARSLIEDAREQAGQTARGFDPYIFRRDLEREIYEDQRDFKQALTDAKDSLQQGRLDDEKKSITQTGDPRWQEAIQNDKENKRGEDKQEADSRDDVKGFVSEPTLDAKQKGDSPRQRNDEATRRWNTDRSVDNGAEKDETESDVAQDLEEDKNVTQEERDALYKIFTSDTTSEKGEKIRSDNLMETRWQLRDVGGEELERQKQLIDQLMLNRSKDDERDDRDEDDSDRLFSQGDSH